MAARNLPAAQGPATVLVGDTSYTYIVERGDHLSKIAKAWLGDADRWPEICELNRHRHFPKVGGTLRDCNIIYPGWDLRLPADARPPADATPTQPPAPPPQVQDPDGVIGEPTPSPSTTVSPSAAAANPVVPTVPATSATPSASTSSTASVSPSAGGSPDASASAPAADEHGVLLPDGSWVTWTLAAAIIAAAALVWLQRRRRFTVDADDDDPPTELPPPVARLRRAVAHHPELTLHAGEAEQAAAVPKLAALPPGGIGLQGDGARAAIVAALASGGPHHPDRRGEVVIDAATLATLIGSDAATLGPWPRLHIADDIDDALTIIEAQLLHRSRILDERSLSDLDTLRQEAPYEEALPPILLVADSPPPGARMRAKYGLVLGTGLRVSALLLGEWAHGATVEVSTDGHTKLLSGQPAEPVPPRLPVLQADAAVHILSTLHEAHTGQPPAAPSFVAPTIALVAIRAAEPAPAAQPEPPTPSAAAASAGAGGRKARLCVLGAPRIEDITEPGRDLRSKARELAVFLACHPDGSSTREIGEYLEPDARLSQADQRVHTNASNLRHNLARAGSADAKAAYVIKSAGRYRLDPATVEVDIWQLRDLLRTGGIATGEHRRALLTQACNLYTAPLADGTDYEWITPHREAVRRWGIEAHLLLAEDLLDTDPHAASTLLDKAIGMDRYNESLYRKAMHARHALGDADGIRTLLRALTKALADLDAEPEEETTALATKLRTSLEHR
ncbi:BTAD domain-containing putative transcriptional regulator [Allorhizocola rhizosphaerae]|uniref:BTAD domain-containing putative transcriptional regulator n=1 Tax=Allorhizocola rhizosphaerae TaxID=1872709 RepID=UPI000E3D042A|nr:BTAD domain-containing putative transcriptional regulator [Allorhizocola rhizosphaerae]